MAPKYDVFISHAGEDKAPLAILIYEGLKRRGISAFLDERELCVAGDAVQDMDEAMRTALIGLFILSPEFALKVYPMLELKCFLWRAGLFGEGAEKSSTDRPALIPVFYRLTVAGCKYAEAFEKMECNQEVKDRFHERVKTGETSIQKVLELLTVLAGRTGIENKTRIGNDDTEETKKRRENLAEDICNEVTSVLLRKVRHVELGNNRDKVADQSADGLHPTFEVPRNPVEVLLDFSTALEDGKALTYEAEVLREVLRGEGRCKVVALLGEGGVGKSCILREVAARKDLKEPFPGGVYFISLGMDASIGTLRSELLRILCISGGKRVAEELRDEESLEVIRGEVGKLMGQARSLLLLDDIWERNGIKAKVVSEMSSVFSNEHGGILMLTTRSAPVACRGDVTIVIKPREFGSKIARGILLNYAKFSACEIEKEGLDWVVENLERMSGGLPICLAVRGRGVGKLRVLLKEGAWLVYWETIKRSTKTLLMEEVDEYKCLNTSLSVALQVLEENELTATEGCELSWSEIYRSLCVMKKQAIMPVCVLQRLWKLGSSGEVLMLLGGLASVGLGEIVLEDGEIRGLKVHDLLHNFAVSLASGEDGVAEWHERLLDGYICAGDRNRVREWWGLENDGYVFQNVCRHLRDSGNGEELVGLLMNVQWTNLRLEHGGLLAWNQDFSYILETLQEEGENGSVEEKRNGLRLMRDAVAECWAFLAPNEREQLAFQMYGRLQEAKEWPVHKYLESVKQWQKGLWLKPDHECWPRPGKGTPQEIPLAGGGALTALALCGEPLYAVIGSARGVLTIINVEEKTVLKRWAGHEHSIQQVAIDNDRKRFLSYSLDGTVRWWDQNTDAEVKRIVLNDVGDCEGGIKRIWKCCKVAFSTDLSMLVSGSEDGEVVLWDLETGKRVGDAMWTSKCGVRCVGMSPNGNQIVAGGEDGSLRMWKVSVSTQQLWDLPRAHKRIGRHKGAVWCVAFSPDGRFVVSGGQDHTLQVWNAVTGEQVGTSLTGHDWDVLCVTFTPDSRSVVSGSGDCTVRVWDVGKAEQVGHPLSGHTQRVLSVAVSGDGRFAVSVGEDSKVRIWNLRYLESRKHDRFRHDSRVVCLAASADKRVYISGNRHYSVHQDTTIRFWDAESGAQIGLPLHEWAVSCVAVSPDNRHFVCGMEDYAMRIWNVVSRSRVGNELRGHTHFVESVAYSLDGQWIVSGSLDKTVRVWRVADYMQVNVGAGGMKSTWMRFRKRSNGAETARNVDKRKERVYWHDNAITCVAFSADGTRIISGSNFGEICFREMSSGKLISSPNSDHRRPITKIDVFEKERVRSLDRKGREQRWHLEGGASQISNSDVRDDNRLERLDSEGFDELPLDDQVVYFDRFVRWRGGGPIIATLPAKVGDLGKAWYYDSSRGVVVTGLDDGQVLLSRFVR